MAGAEESVIRAVDAQRGDVGAFDAAAHTGEETAGVAGVEMHRGPVGDERVHRAKQGIARCVVERFETVERDGVGQRQITATRAHQRTEVSAACERFADVPGQRANVGALAAAHVDDPARALAFHDLDGMDDHFARRALDVDAFAGICIERPPFVLERRVHGRHLRDAADEAGAGALDVGSRGLYRARAQRVAFGVAGARRLAE